MIKSKSGSKNGFQDTLELRSCIAKLAASVFVTTGTEVSVLMTQDGIDRRLWAGWLETQGSEGFLHKSENQWFRRGKGSVRMQTGLMGTSLADEQKCVISIWEGYREVVSSCKSILAKARKCGIRMQEFVFSGKGFPESSGEREEREK